MNVFEGSRTAAVTTGKYFDELELGTEWVTVGRTVTESDIMAFCGIGGDFNPLHTDEVWCREHTPFRGRVAHGPLILAMTLGAFNRLHILEGTSVAALGLKECNYRKVVYPGDTIRSTITVTGLRRTSRGDRGILQVTVRTLNQDGELVQDFVYVTMLSCAPAK